MVEAAQTEKRGKLYTVAAPSGVGKTSLVKAVVDSMPNLHASISYTTRPQRPNEVDGVNYRFVDEAIFKQMITHEDFLEYATVFHHYYGTSNRWVERQLEKGRNVILEIDWQGVRQIKHLFPECVRIFILPPSLNALKKRLEARGEDSESVIEDRMAAGRAEISHYKESEFLVVNDEFTVALAELQHIVSGDVDDSLSKLTQNRQLAERLLA